MLVCEKTSIAAYARIFQIPNQNSIIKVAVIKHLVGVFMKYTSTGQVFINPIFFDQIS